MKVQNMKLADIKPYEHNPRLNADAVDAVAKSICEFGWQQPLVVDKNLVIIAGHTRALAAKRLGLETVPVIVADKLTPEQVRAFRIADNKTGEIAQWDYKLLPFELQALQDAEFDLSLLGFDSDELDKLLNGDDPVADGETEPDAVPDVPDTAQSETGKVYRLGKHMLLCGDATKAGDVAKLMGEGLADLWLTDPPYNVALEGSNGLTIQNDNLPDAKFRAFLGEAFKSAIAAMKPGATFYIFHSDGEESFNFRAACRDAGLQVRQNIIWKKNALVLGRQDYQWIHEPCLMGWKDGAAHSWYSDCKQTTVMEFDKPKRNDVHPSMKPVEMLVYLVKNSSKRGDTVLDTFGGSGSTLIACEQTGRVCRMMELDPKYCDVIRKRWAEFIHGEGCDWASLTPAKG